MAGVFISYRRSDAGGWAGRFSDSLTTALGRATIFRDIDTIPPGVEFASFIAEAVGSCEVLIALIGPTWLTASESGKRRLDDPNDFTRMEIATALRRNIRVIPALVGGARIPASDDLPDDLKPLAGRNAYELTDSRWADDCRKLAEVLRPLVGRKSKSLLGNAAMKVAAAILIALLALGGYGIKVWYDSRTHADGVQDMRRLTRSIGALGDLTKGRAALALLGVDTAGLDTLDKVKLELQRQVRTAGTPQAIAEVNKAFRSAGILAPP